MDALDEFEALLRQTMGLDAASIGIHFIERAVQQRQAACRLPDPRAYLAHVRCSDTELQELVEAVVVPETWFFRYRPAFRALVQLLTQTSGRVFRLLSLPCSSGEEPYSMAMALFDAGLDADRFRIDAVDISAHALRTAELGMYGNNSFRGSALDFRERHFEATPQGYRIADRIRRQVHFQQGNLFVPDLLASIEYDIVFCRHLLIYFEGSTQERAVQVLARLLAKDGRLFVGPPEAGLMQRSGFAAAKVMGTFCFHKTDEAMREPIAAPAVSIVPTSTPSKKTNIVLRRPVPATPPPTPADVTYLDRAGRLADQGRLAEAAALCEQHLRQQGPSVQPFYLLGLVRDAEGKHGLAEDCYRKALYLDPNHQEALVHLVCLLEKRGDSAGARVLHERLKRCHTRKPEVA